MEGVQGVVGTVAGTGVSDRRQIIIVGGGVIGIACAHYLMEAGFEITVIDQGTIGGGCSRGNCGYISPSHVLPLTEPGAVRTALLSMLRPNAPFRVKPRFSPALWKWMFQFARRCTHQQMLTAAHHVQSLLESTIVEYRRLGEALSPAARWKPHGLLCVMKTAAGMEHHAHSDAMMRNEFGVK